MPFLSTRGALAEGVAAASAAGFAAVDARFLGGIVRVCVGGEDGRRGLYVSAVLPFFASRVATRSLAGFLNRRGPIAVQSTRVGGNAGPAGAAPRLSRDSATGLFFAPSLRTDRRSSILGVAVRAARPAPRGAMRALDALLLALLACSAPPPAAAGLDASAPGRLRAKLLGRSSWLASTNAAALSSQRRAGPTPADASTDVTLCASVVAGAAVDAGAGGEIARTRERLRRLLAARAL